MKTIFITSVLCLLAFNIQAEESRCKTVKTCIQWVSSKTGATYNPTKMDGRSLKTEKDLDLDSGDADALFGYLLNQSEMARVKRDNGSYDIVNARDLKEITFPIVKAENLQGNFDFTAMEFSYSNEKKAKNAMLVLKKYISKFGRIVQSSDGSKIFVTDTGYSLIGLKEIAESLNR